MLLEHQLIYICASEDDREKVEQIYEALRKQKFDVFWDVIDVKPAQKERQIREERFDASGLFLFVWSENFIQQGDKLKEVALKAFEKQAAELSDPYQYFRYVFPYALDDEAFRVLFGDDWDDIRPIRAYDYDEQDAIRLLYMAFREELEQREPVLRQIEFQRQRAGQEKKKMAVRELRAKIQQGELDQVLAKEIIQICKGPIHLDWGVLSGIIFALIKVEVYKVLKLIESIMNLDLNMGKQMFSFYLAQVEYKRGETNWQIDSLKWELSRK